MNIKDEENRLFEEWKQSNDKPVGDFVPDGTVNPKRFHVANKKLLFVLKEANMTEGPDSNEDSKERSPVPFDLRQYLVEGAEGSTWNNVTRWTRGILNLENDLNWCAHKLGNVDNDCRKKYLPEICALNLNKWGGGGFTKESEFRESVMKDVPFIRKQLSLYLDNCKLDFVICCGSIVWELLMGTIIKEQNPNSEAYTNRGVVYKRLPTGTIVINYYHPQAHWPAHMLYYTLIDAVRELSDSTRSN